MLRLISFTVPLTVNISYIYTFFETILVWLLVRVVLGLNDLIIICIHSHIPFFKSPLLSQMIAFSLPEPAPKFTKLGICVTPAKKFHNLLSSSISTTRWCYNQGKCILAYDSYILCRIFKKLTSTRSLNCAESCDIGHPHFC